MARWLSDKDQAPNGGVKELGRFSSDQRHTVSSGWSEGPKCWSEEAERSQRRPTGGREVVVRRWSRQQRRPQGAGVVVETSDKVTNCIRSGMS